MKVKALFNMAKTHISSYIALIVLVIFHRVSYSYIPLFTQYLINKLYQAFPIVGQVQNDPTSVNFPKFLINFFESGKDIITVAIYVAISLVIYQFIRYTLMFFENHLRGSIKEKIAKETRLKLYDKIQNLDFEFHNKSDSGDLIQRVTSDVETTSSFVVAQFTSLIALLASLFAGAFQMYYINQTIMWLCLAVIPIYGIASTIYFVKIEKIFERVEKSESEMMTVIQENVSGTKVVKAFANENFEIEKMENKNSRYRNMTLKASKIVAYYWGAMDFMSMMQYGLVIVIAIIAVKNQTMDPGSVAASIMLVGTLVWPIRGLGRLINEFSKATVAVGRIEEIMTKKSEHDGDGILTPNLEGHINFKNVSFKFNDTETELLKDISFEILPGETVAFIGKTGSGKSTIINILLKMYDYQGSITIDGVELREINKKHIRSNIGVVLQDPFLYSKTVMQNLSIANKNASEEDVKKAAEIAALAKDIHTFKQGYDTKVGEKGTTLSGGQKQRVAIARVLVSEKPILIFDDALSAVDNKTDLMIRNALANKTYKSTNIIITHRITTAKDASKIIVINNSKIEAIGKHEELSSKEGLYKSLWGIQGKLEKEFLALVKEDN